MKNRKILLEFFFCIKSCKFKKNEIKEKVLKKDLTCESGFQYKVFFVACFYLFSVLIKKNSSSFETRKNFKIYKIMLFVAVVVILSSI